MAGVGTNVAAAVGIVVGALVGEGVAVGIAVAVGGRGVGVAERVVRVGSGLGVQVGVGAITIGVAGLGVGVDGTDTLRLAGVGVAAATAANTTCAVRIGCVGLGFPMGTLLDRGVERRPAVEVSSSVITFVANWEIGLGLAISTRSVMTIGVAAAAGCC